MNSTKPILVPGKTVVKMKGYPGTEFIFFKKSEDFGGGYVQLQEGQVLKEVPMTQFLQNYEIVEPGGAG